MFLKNYLFQYPTECKIKNNHFKIQLPKSRLMGLLRNKIPILFMLDSLCKINPNHIPSEIGFASNFRRVLSNGLTRNSLTSQVRENSTLTTHRLFIGAAGSVVPTTLSVDHCLLFLSWNLHTIVVDVMAKNGNKSIQAKLVLLGDMGTGKTSLVLRFVKGQFFDFKESTIGAAFFTQILSLNEATIKFDIWDTAGQERYHSLAPMYYRGASAAVIVYDITSMDSFRRAKKWVEELQDRGNPNMVMVLVGNKADLESSRKVATEEGEQYAKENGMFFMETSAKTAHNVNELFYEVAKRLAKANTVLPTGMKLRNGTQESRSLFCCSG